MASGTLPKTEFCAEVGTCTGSPAELGAGLGGEPEVEVSELDFELWAESGAVRTDNPRAIPSAWAKRKFPRLLIFSALDGPAIRFKQGKIHD